MLGQCVFGNKIMTKNEKKYLFVHVLFIVIRTLYPQCLCIIVIFNLHVDTVLFVFKNNFVFFRPHWLQTAFSPFYIFTLKSRFLSTPFKYSLYIFFSCSSIPPPRGPPGGARGGIINHRFSKSFEKPRAPLNSPWKKLQIRGPKSKKVDFWIFWGPPGGIKRK